jgi:hypothetical protein
MRDLYSHLGLGEFAQLVPRLSRHLTSVADYRTNHNQLTESERDMVRRRWGRIIAKYGYDRSIPVEVRPRRTVLNNSPAESALAAAN